MSYTLDNCLIYLVISRGNFSDHIRGIQDRALNLLIVNQGSYRQ